MNLSQNHGGEAKTKPQNRINEFHMNFDDTASLVEVQDVKYYSY